MECRRYVVDFEKWCIFIRLCRVRLFSTNLLNTVFVKCCYLFSYTTIFFHVHFIFSDVYYSDKSIFCATSFKRQDRNLKSPTIRSRRTVLVDGRLDCDASGLMN